MTKGTNAEPLDDSYQDKRTHLTVAATWKDPATGALYVHQDLTRVQEAWAEEAHIPPMRAKEAFGDVESFVEYVQRYGIKSTAFLTWNNQGLRAVLDYADEGGNRSSGRSQWTACLPFRHSVEWATWTAFANGQNWAQKAAVEKLEDLASDIKEPTPADLMGLLRSLRATVNARADAELRPDGTTKVAFEKDTKVASSAAVDIPSAFLIAIPVLKGHIDAEGRPVLYRIAVRLRVSVDDNAKLGLRFAIPNADRVLEDVYADRVNAARALLGEDFDLLRAADA